MKLFDLNKCTLKARDPFIIYDAENKVYEEVKRPRNGIYKTTVRAGSYNLPPGVKIAPFQPAKLPELPPRQRFRNIGRLKVIYSDQAPKAGLVNWKKGVILLNPYLRREEPAKRDFILFHELGHARYKSEYFCDLFAAENCNRKGDSLNKIIDLVTTARPYSNTTEKTVRTLNKHV